MLDDAVHLCTVPRPMEWYQNMHYCHAQAIIQIMFNAMCNSQKSQENITSRQLCIPTIYVYSL